MEMNGKDYEKIWNHIETLNHETGILCQHQAEIKTDVQWLKKFQWLILSTAIGGVIIGLIRLFIGGCF